MAKRIIIGVAVKDRPVQFRLSHTGADATLLNEESLPKSKAVEYEETFEKCVWKIKEVQRGFHSLARGHVLWHGNTGAIVWDM